MNIAMKVKAFRAKHGSTPPVAMITPAIAGPNIRAHWTITLFSATAFTTRSDPTISITKL